MVAWWRARCAYLSQGCDSSVEKSDIDWLGAVNLCPIIARKLSKINVNYRQSIGENRQTIANQLLANTTQSATGYPPPPTHSHYQITTHHLLNPHKCVQSRP